MSESVLIAVIGAVGVLLGALISGSVLWYVAIRKTPSEIDALDAQETLSISAALKNAAESIDVLIKSQASERHDLESRIEELEAHRSERSRQIYTLEKTIQDLQQTIEARDREYAKAIGELEKQITDERKKSAAYKTAVERLIEILQNIDPNLLDGIELPDTLRKIKAVQK